MILHQPRGRLRTAVLTALLAISLMAGALPAQADSADPVFVMTNAADGNQVLVYRAGRDGLDHVDTVDTGGLGTGDGLGSQGAVTLSDNGRHLLVVNAGDDTVSLFGARGTQLTLIDTVSSAGARPISVDVHHSIAYVVNADSDSIAGFRVGAGGLTPISHSVQSLSGEGVGPAQVEFSPNGRTLAVTEKGTNLITTFGVDRRGRASEGTSTPSAGETPFGFEFDRRGHLVASEAFGGADGASTVSSYAVSRNGGLSVLDGPVATTQTAACWVAISRGHVYTTNTGSNTVSRFALSRQGDLTLVDQTPTEGSPTDLDFSDDGKHLYVVNASSDSLSLYDVNHDGSLVPVGVLEGLPASALGVAAG